MIIYIFIHVYDITSNNVDLYKETFIVYILNEDMYIYIYIYIYISHFIGRRMSEKSCNFAFETMIVFSISACMSRLF